jgi:hypothetical protein
MNPANFHPIQNKKSSKASSTETDDEKHEKAEYEKAVQRVREATQKEAELEVQLQILAPTPSIASDIENRLTGAYGRRIRDTAQTVWRQRLQDNADRLQDIELGEGHAAITAEMEHNGRPFIGMQLRETWHAGHEHVFLNVCKISVQDIFSHPGIQEGMVWIW